MRTEVGRRVFVGSVVAGLPLLAGRTGLLAQGTSPLHDHPTVTVADPVIDQILRQIAVIHNRAQAGPRGEDARALAMQLRMLAVYERQLGVDREIRAVVREMVDREGRNTILYSEPDPVEREREMRRYGFQANERLRNAVPPPTHAQREAGLDRLLATGVTPALVRLADRAEAIGADLDRHPIGRLNIGLEDADYLQGYCESLWDSYTDAQVMAAPVCLAARYFEWVTPSCYALQGGAFTLLLVWVIKCHGIGN